MRPHGQKFSRTTWYYMVVRPKTCRGSVDSRGDVCRATKIVNRQMSVHFKRKSCDIMISQRCCVLSDIIWTYFRHFSSCSRAKFIKKNHGCLDVDHTTTFCMTTTHFMSHNLLYKVVWPNCCPCGRTLRLATGHNCRIASVAALEGDAQCLNFSINMIRFEKVGG